MIAIKRIALIFGIMNDEKVIFVLWNFVLAQQRGVSNTNGYADCVCVNIFANQCNSINNLNKYAYANKICYLYQHTAPAATNSNGVQVNYARYCNANTDSPTDEYATADTARARMGLVGQKYLARASISVGAVPTQNTNLAL